MNKELIIRSNSDNVDFALLKEGKLIEYQKDKDNNKFSVGDVFIAKVRKSIPGLNAAFVNVGYEKDGFLHYLDLGMQVNSMKKFTEKTISDKLNTASLKSFKKEKTIDKDGKISDTLKSGDHLLLQISKEPISTKGPRLTAELSLAGRYMVLTPFSDKVSVSQKIAKNEEKTRLNRLRLVFPIFVPPGSRIYLSLT